MTEDEIDASGAPHSGIRRSPSNDDMLALADEYDAGTVKAVSTGYEEFGATFVAKRKMISDALRFHAAHLSANRIEQEGVREALERFVDVAHKTHGLAERTRAALAKVTRPPSLPGRAALREQYALTLWISRGGSSEAFAEHLKRLGTARPSDYPPFVDCLRDADAILSLITKGTVEADPSRDDLIASIQFAIGDLSSFVDEYHDFDYETHQVPAELQALKNIQHHLEGSLISATGEAAALTPVTDVGRPCPAQGCAEVVGDRKDPRWDQGQCPECNMWFWMSEPLSRTPSHE